MLSIFSILSILSVIYKLLGSGQCYSEDALESSQETGIDQPECDCEENYTTKYHDGVCHELFSCRPYDLLELLSYTPEVCEQSALLALVFAVLTLFVCGCLCSLCEFFSRLILLASVALVFSHLYVSVYI